MKSILGDVHRFLQIATLEECVMRLHVCVCFWRNRERKEKQQFFQKLNKYFIVFWWQLKAFKS